MTDRRRVGQHVLEPIHEERVNHRKVTGVFMRRPLPGRRSPFEQRRGYLADEWNDYQRCPLERVDDGACGCHDGILSASGPPDTIGA